MFSNSCILRHSCIVVFVRDRAWDLEVLCSGDVGLVHSYRWSIVWEDMNGVICVMIHSCGDGLGIAAINVSGDSRSARIRVGVILKSGVVLVVLCGVV